LSEKKESSEIKKTLHVAAMKQNTKTIGLIILAGIILTLMQCKKEKQNDYSYCTGCPIEAWAGDYSGTGTYFTTNTGETIPDVEVDLSIEHPGGNNLKINIRSPKLVSFQFFGTKNNDEHYFTIAGNTQSLDLTLYQKGNEYKINGTTKTYISIKDSVVVNKVLTFRVFKKLN